MRDRPHKPTSADIARLAGVSRSTVSRVINGYLNVPEATRRRVQEVIAQHGYFPSTTGQVLRGKRSRCVGLFVHDTGFDADLQASFIYAFTERAHALGYMTLLGCVNQIATPAGEHAVRTLLSSGRVDAGVFINAWGAGELIRDLLDEGQVIGAVGMQSADEEERLFTVALDEAITHDLVAHASGMGHRTLAFICDANSHIDCLGWHRRMMQAAEGRGMQLLCPGCAGKACVPVAAQVEAALAQDAHHLLLVCADQAAVFAAYHAVHARGLTIGTDVSILGMGVIQDTLPLWPPLSGYRYDGREMAHTLANQLIGGLEGALDAQRHSRITYRWMQGASCAASPI